MKISFVAVSLIVLALSGCAAKWTQEGAGPYPDNYKEIVSAFVKKTHYDPYSLRDVAISKPTPGVFFVNQGYYVCFQCNAKNRMGGYVGISRNAYLINSSGVILAFENAMRCNDGQPDAAMLEPWPEMEMAGDK